jgi:hypothetical protein
MAHFSETHRCFISKWSTVAVLVATAAIVCLRFHRLNDILFSSIIFIAAYLPTILYIIWLYFIKMEVTIEGSEIRDRYRALPADDTFELGSELPDNSYFTTEGFSGLRGQAWGKNHGIYCT